MSNNSELIIYTTDDGKTYNVDYYNLDVIISVGYRVKSRRGVQFRIWAGGILKEYLKKALPWTMTALKSWAEADISRSCSKEYMFNAIEEGSDFAAKNNRLACAPR